MPLRIDYSPLGALGSLAVAGGKGAAHQQNLARDMQLIQLSEQRSEAQARQAAQDKAFSLQQAMANRMISQTSPVADHIQERANLTAQARAAQQKQYKDQLDSMLAKGSIDPAQYQKGLLASMTGNDTLMTEVFKQPKAAAAAKPNISNSGELAVIRQPFTEKRRILEQQLTALRNQMAKYAMIPEMSAPLEKQQATLQKQIDDLFAQEGTAINEWRVKGEQMYDNAEEAPAEESTTGTGTVIYRPTTTPSEQSILQAARGMAGSGAASIGVAGTTTQTLGGGTPPAEYPDAVWNEQRKMWTVIRNGRLMGVQ